MNSAPARPAARGAIAEAVLEELSTVKARGVVTTHYSNLKLMADRYPSIVNSAMLFDIKNMQPLYTLRTGRPGSSFALEIAGKIGFPEDVLQAARQRPARPARLRAATTGELKERRTSLSASAPGSR